jgi:hypothetical protein
MKTNEQLKSELYAPLPSEAIKPHPTKTFLSTIKPIYVTDRLNEVFGIGKWQLRTENILVNDNGTVVNKVIFSVPDHDIYYECFGGNDNGGQTSKGFDLGDAFKGATTDGLTKICSYLGIGIDVFRGKQSSKSYNTPSQPAPKPATPTVDDRASKAIAKLKAITKLNEVPFLIKSQKDFKATPEGSALISGASIEDIVKLNSIDVVLDFYNFVNTIK